MAGPFDFSNQQPPPQNADEDAIRNQWASFLDQPGARAALLNFGISLMQPPSFGDTFTSQLGRAVGRGAEAVNRGELQESKIGEQEARSQAAVARAQLAGERSSFEPFRQQALSERASQSQEIQLQKQYIQSRDKAEQLYNKQKEAYDKEYSGIRPEKRPPPPEKQPFPSYEDWKATFGPSVFSGVGLSGRQPPKVGDVVKGFEFLGGNPGNPSNWKKVGQSG